MKNILLLIVVLLINCNQNKVENTMITTEEKFSVNEQNTFIVEVKSKLPFELYIDDIKAEDKSHGTNMAVELNPYLLKNGRYKIKIKLFPIIQAGKTHIDAVDIKNSSFGFGRYIKNKQTGEVSLYEIEKQLTLNSPQNNVLYFEQEWEVEIKDLPYELEGWRNGQDLSKINEKELEEKVVNYYKNLWQILNNGQGEKYIQLWKQCDREAAKFDFIENDVLEKMNNEISKEITERAKNKMIPLEDYKMHIYANGKLVTLERKSHTKEFNNYSPLDLKGWSPLIRKHDITGGTQYPVLLYLPQNSNEFVIIRK